LREFISAEGVRYRVILNHNQKSIQEKSLRAHETFAECLAKYSDKASCVVS